MTNLWTTLSASAAILFIASCTPAITEPAVTSLWETKHVPPEVEQEDPKRDRCIENCG